MKNRKLIKGLAVLIFVCFIAAVSYIGCGGGGGGGSSGSSAPTPPAQVTSPNPSNGATNVSITAQLSWAAASGATSYDIYFGITTTAWTPVTSTGTSYNPGALNYITIYYWRIDSKNSESTTAGNVWSFTTKPPAPICTTNTADNTTVNSARLNGTVNPNGFASTAYFNYGLTTSYTVTTTLQVIGSGTSNVAISDTASSLTPNTLYNFRVAGVNSYGTTYGSNLTVTTAPLPPTCTTNAATNVTYNSATLNGTVNPNGTNVTFCYFDYGTTLSYGISATVVSLPGSGSSPVSVTANVSSLAFSQEYNFRVVATNAGGTTNGLNQTLTTSPPPAPTCTTNPATAVTYNSATLNGTVNPNGFNVTFCYFDYGTTESYGSQQNVASLPGNGSSPISVTANVSSLTSSQLYNFRVVATNAGGTTNGLNQTLTTSAPPPPTCTTNVATNVTYNSATLNGTVNPNGFATTAYFNYGLTTSYTVTTTSQALGSGGSNVAISDTISSLTPITLYNFRVVGINANGTTYGDNLTFITIYQEAYAKASNTAVSDAFGISVAISGDTMVVGAYQEDSNATGINGNQNDNSAQDSGAVYVFTRTGITWTQQAYIKPSNTGAGDWFGYRVAISGDTIAVGARFEDSSTTGINSSPNDDAANSGAVYVFTRTGITWTQQAYIKASNTEAGDLFGYSLSISGDTLVVGTTQEDSSTTGVNSSPNEGAAGSGAVYVFTRTGENWTQEAYIKPSNTGAGDEFGSSVSVSSDTIAVGARLEDSSTTGINSSPNDDAIDSGAIYVFTRTGITWTQQSYIKASNTGAGDAFGIIVSISGDTIAAGSFQEDSNATGINGNQSNESAADSGAVYVFTRTGITWTQQAYIKASNTGAGDFFGMSLVVSGDTLIVGAPCEDSSTTGINSSQNNSAQDSGAVYVFTRTGSDWSQLAYIKASNTGVDDWFSNSVSISGDTIVAGAYSEDSSTTGVNSAPDDNGADSGAAYIFR